MKIILTILVMASICISSVAFADEKTTIYSGESLDAISFPLGGIGTGDIQINGRGQFHIWQIFNNYNKLNLPHTLYAIRTTDPWDNKVVRTLQTVEEDGFASVDSLTFEGEYPLCRYRYFDRKLPVSVSMKAFNPMVPFDPKSSAIPCAIVKFQIKNTQNHTIDVDFLTTQFNAAGYDSGSNGLVGEHLVNMYGNEAEVIKGHDHVSVYQSVVKPRLSRGYGNMMLTVLDGNTSAVANIADIKNFSREFAETGTVSGNSKVNAMIWGNTCTAAMCTPFRLKPNEEKELTYIISWYFSNPYFDFGKGSGNMYENWYTSSKDVDQSVRENLPELETKTREYHDALYQTDLPRWFLDRISSQIASFRSKSVFWDIKGFLGGYEGVHETKNVPSCEGNCLHVWHYAQSHAFLYPETAKKFREEAFEEQRKDGSIPFRLGYAAGRHPVATDGLLGEILSTFREYLNSTDTRWLQDNWPFAKKAIEYSINEWDEDEDGILGGLQNNTLDSHMNGCSSWLGSMYLAALSASEKMAKLMGDDSAAIKYARIWKAGSSAQNELLWNGEYFRQISNGEEAGRDYYNGCSIDQLLGVWWAGILDLPYPYQEDRIVTSLKSLYKYNFFQNFKNKEITTRRFVTENDAGMVMITWPHDDAPDLAHRTPLQDDVMSGFEYSAAATMIQHGLLEEGFNVVKAVSDRYCGKKPSIELQHCPDTGNPFAEDETGKWYIRPMSNWSLLLALQGFKFNGPERTIGFMPRYKPQNHTSFFTFQKSYGVFHQKIERNNQAMDIEVKSGNIQIDHFQLAIPENKRLLSVKAYINDTPVAVKEEIRKDRIDLAFEKTIEIKRDGRLAIHIKMK